MNIEIIPFIVALLSLAVSYLFTKQREREAELRKEKLENYKEFAESLSGIITGESTAEGKRAFSKACNKLNFIASQSVLKALQLYQQEINVKNTERKKELHDHLLSDLFYEIRKDLKVKPKDDKESFKVYLWKSGITDKEKS